MCNGKLISFHIMEALVIVAWASGRHGINYDKILNLQTNYCINLQQIMLLICNELWYCTGCAQPRP